MPRRTPRDARRRALGQNFLHDQSVVADIVGTLHPPPGALVVDLGAGAGALTRAVAAGGHRVLAVELDPHWARHLRTHAPTWGAVSVSRGDALRVPFPAERFLVVSNAPYAIGTKLVRRLLTDAHGLTRAVVVLQREAALRLAGGGRFAASWAPWFELAVHGRIPARAFRPVALSGQRDPDHRPAAHPVALARRLPRLRRVPARRVQRPGQHARPPPGRPPGRASTPSGSRATRRPGRSRRRATRASSNR